MAKKKLTKADLAELAKVREWLDGIAGQAQAYAEFVHGVADELDEEKAEELRDTLTAIGDALDNIESSSSDAVSSFDDIANEDATAK